MFNGSIFRSIFFEEIDHLCLGSLHIFLNVIVNLFFVSTAQSVEFFKKAIKLFDHCNLFQTISHDRFDLV